MKKSEYVARMNEKLKQQTIERENYRRDVLWLTAKHYLNASRATMDNDTSQAAIAHTHKMFACCAMLDDSIKRWTTAKMVRGFLVDINYLDTKGDVVDRGWDEGKLREALDERVVGIRGFDTFGVRPDNGQDRKEEGGRKGVEGHA